MQGHLSFAKSFLTLALMALGCAHPNQARAADAKPEPSLVWTDIRTLGVEGRGWTNTQSFFDRLPAKAEKVVRPPVWNLSHDSSGMLVRFLTDATAIQARWSLVSPSLAMPHMAATGVSGLDLYVRTGEGWRWAGVGQPKERTNTASLISGMAPGNREFMLYLPLYNGVYSVEIGVAPDRKVTPAGPWGPGERKPILFYGTSIMQGGCATRPGMAHAAIVGRHLNWPTINLGFSGNGKMEPELAELCAELDPAVYVLDCLPNMSPEQVAERVEPFVKTLRAAHPRVPIVLVEDRESPNAFLLPQRQEHFKTMSKNLTAAYENLRRTGVKDLYYVPRKDLLAADGEGTVDGSHPTDLGFMQHAVVMEKVLKPLLKK